MDDDLDFVQINKIYLEKEGYRVSCAYSAKEGWRMVEKEKPDLILMDLMMENLDSGMALSQQVKGHKEYASTPILMLTSISRETGMDFTPRSPEELKQLKVDEYCSKPIKPKALLEKVQRLLAGKPGLKKD